VDWVTDELDTLDDPLHVIDNHVFISAPDITWQGAGPFGMLLEKMGGTVAAHELDTSSIVLNISAAAPDEAAAARAGDVLKRYVSMPYDGSPARKELLGSIGDVPEFVSAGTRVEVDGRRLRVENPGLDSEWETIPRFVKALESMGFTEIRYEFVQQWQVRSPTVEAWSGPSQGKYTVGGVLWAVISLVLIAILFIPAQIYRLVRFLLGKRP
jgi:hypothetical protein